MDLLLFEILLLLLLDFLGHCRYFWPNFTDTFSRFLQLSFSLSFFLAVPWGLYNLSSPGLRQWKSPVLTIELQGILSATFFQSSLSSVNLFFIILTFCCGLKVAFSFPICLVYSINFQNFLLKKSFSPSTLSSMFSYSVPVTISFFSFSCTNQRIWYILIVVKCTDTGFCLSVNGITQKSGTMVRLDVSL